MTKVRDILTDDKGDWELRVSSVSPPDLLSVSAASVLVIDLCLLSPQLKKVRSLLLAGAADFDEFLQQLRLTEAAFKLSAKDLRSQVVKEACVTLG